MLERMVPVMPNPSAVVSRMAPIYFALWGLAMAWCVTAQAEQPDRIVTNIDRAQTVILKGNVHPKAQPQYDQGPVDPSMRLPYITMSTKRTANQEADLKRFLQEQQIGRASCRGRV